VEEFSYSEIADMLEIPVGTVMSRISRGRRALYERLTVTGQQSPVTSQQSPVGSHQSATKVSLTNPRLETVHE
jgi:hypothetical protein